MMFTLTKFITHLCLVGKMRFPFGVRYFQFFLMFAAIVIFYGHRSSLSVAIIPMKKTYPTWSADTILASFFWGYIIPQVGAGQLAEFWGPRWVLCATMIVGSIFHVLVPIAASFGPGAVIACRIIQGLNQGFLFPCTHNLISRWTPLNQRTTVSSFIYGGASLGTAISMFFPGSGLGWQLVFYVYGALGMFCGLCFGFFIRNSPSQHWGISQEERNYIETGNSVNRLKKVPTPWKRILASLPVWAIFVTTCGQNWGSFTMLTEMPTYLATVMEFDVKSVSAANFYMYPKALFQNSAFSALPYVFMFFVQISAAPVADKLVKTMSIATVRKIFNSLGTFIPATALFSLGFLDKNQPIFVVVLLIAAVSSSAFASAGRIVNILDLAPNHAGTLMGLINSVATIFSMLAPLSVEFLGSDKLHGGLWKRVFWLSAGIYFITGIFYAVFSQGEIQQWNDSEEKKSMNNVN